MKKLQSGSKKNGSLFVKNQYKTICMFETKMLYIWLIKSVVCIIIHIYKKILPIEQSLMEGLLGPPVVPQFRSPPFNKRQSCLSPFF